MRLDTSAVRSETPTSEKPHGRENDFFLRALLSEEARDPDEGGEPYLERLAGPLTLTPTLAEVFLNRNIARNRPRLKRRHVENLANAMVRGEWMDNGDSIKFDSYGRMIDGQNRCAAVMAAGVDIQTTIVLGLEPRAMDTLDQNMKRSIGHTLAMHGITDANQMSRAGRICMIFAEVELSKDKTMPHSFRSREAYTNTQILNFVEANPGLSEWLPFGRRMRESLQTSIGGATALAYLFTSANPDVALPYMDSLETGANLKEDDPVLAVRRRLISTREHKLDMAAKSNNEVALIVKGFNATVMGSSMRLLRIGREEPMPRIIGLKVKRKDQTYVIVQN